MIVKMQKVAVLSLASQERALLDSLKALGVLHVTRLEKPERHESESVSDRIKTVMGVINTLDNCPKYARPCTLKPEEVVERVLQLTGDIAAAQDQAIKLQNQLAALEVWGDFDPADIARLAASGVTVRLYQCQDDQLPEIPEGAVMQVIARGQGQTAFALASREDFALDIPEVQLPEASTSELRSQREGLLSRIESQNLELCALQSAIPALKEYQKRLEGELSYAQAYDSISAQGKVCYLEGYVPDTRIEDLKAAAAREGWGLWYEDADRNDPNVPTLLDTPGWLKPVSVFFDFIDAMPSYSECDISLPVMIFFTLFFSIIVGDAGYGLLYLAAGILLKLKVKSRAARQPIAFLIILSSATVVWGLLTGSFFGIAKECLPWFLAGLPCLRDSEQSMKCIQWFCFATAMVHLAGARIWRAVIAGSLREALGNLGWMFFITCNFFAIITLIVKDPFPFMAHPGFEQFPVWCFAGGGIGAVLILLFSVKWTEIGDVLYTPFNFINSFVDVLSYIRLFAVGLSGAYIAQCFNNMGAMIYGGKTGLALVVCGILGGLVIVIGHVLNIVLGMMSVLVHGLRLNTLEFSNHMQIGWEGRAYRPFSEEKEQTNNK